MLWGDKRAVLFNDPYAKLLGAKPEASLGKPFDELASPSSGQLARYLHAAFDGNSGRVDDGKIRITRGSTAETRFCSFACTPIFFPADAGEPLGVFCTLMDQTNDMEEGAELRRQFERLHELYEHAPGFIAMTEGPEHRFTVANAAYRLLVDRIDIVGRTVADVLPEVVAQGFIETLDRVYETGIPFVGRGLPLSLIDPETQERRKLFIDTIYHPVRSSGGEIVGLFAEGHDVTQQVEAQNLAAGLQAQLLRVSRATAMESLGTAVAHEINQPLAAAANYLAVATKLVGQEGQEQRLATMIERASIAALRSGEILKRLRNLSAGAGETRRCDLVQIVIEAISLTRMADQSLSISTTALHPCEVSVDPVQIQQVLVNLIKNAREATAKSEDPVIEVAVSRETTSAVVSVEDRGGGVDPTKSDHLFEWFMTTKSEGSGIGLPISKQIVEAHGGRLWFEEAPRGAKFCFSIPLAHGSVS